MASAQPSTSPAGTSRAAPPATSRTAGMSDATTAVPWLMASSTGRPNPSWRLGKANTAAPAYSDHSSSSADRAELAQVGPRAAAIGGRAPDRRSSQPGIAGQHQRASARRLAGLLRRPQAGHGRHEGSDPLARFEAADPQHEGPVGQPPSRPESAAGAPGAIDRRGDAPLGTTRIRVRPGWSSAPAISSAAASLTVRTRSARRAAAASPSRWKRRPRAGKASGNSAGAASCTVTTSGTPGMRAGPPPTGRAPARHRPSSGQPGPARTAASPRTAAAGAAAARRARPTVAASDPGLPQGGRHRGPGMPGGKRHHLVVRGTPSAVQSAAAPCTGRCRPATGTGAAPH